MRDQGFLVHGRDGDRDFLAGLPADLRQAAEATLPGPDSLDRNDYLAILDELHAHYRDHPRLEVWFGPPGPPWVSDSFLAAIAERAEALDTGIQTHLEESYYARTTLGLRRLSRRHRRAGRGARYRHPDPSGGILLRAPAWAPRVRPGEPSASCPRAFPSPTASG
jgi:hypothetical protein